MRPKVFSFALVPESQCQTAEGSTRTTIACVAPTSRARSVVVASSSVTEDALNVRNALFLVVRANMPRVCASRARSVGIREHWSSVSPIWRRCWRVCLSTGLAALSRRKCRTMIQVVMSRNRLKVFLALVATLEMEERIRLTVESDNNNSSSRSDRTTVQRGHHEARHRQLRRARQARRAR